MIIPLKDRIDKFEFGYIGLILISKLLIIIALVLACFEKNILFDIIDVVLTLIGLPLVFGSIFFFIACGLGYFKRRNLLIILSSLELFEFALSMPLGFAVFDTPDTIAAFSRMGQLYFLLKPGSDFFFFIILTTISTLIVTITFLRYEKIKEIIYLEGEKSLLRSAFFFLTSLIGLIIITPIYIYFSGNYIILTISRGFFEIENFELKSIERIYKKNGKTLSLIPMVHVGEKDFYNEVAKSYYEDGTLILREGVSDKKKRIKHDGSHSKISALLGLSAQADELKVKDNDKIKIISGDIDASDFSKKTLDILNLALKINENLDKPAAFTSDYLKLDVLLKEKEDRTEFYRELIILRNEALLKAFDKNHKDYNRIVVPWGGLHMPSLEEEFKKRGFSLVESSKRTVVYFLKK